MYIIEQVAHAHAPNNVPLEWFSSTPGLGVMPRLLSELVAYPVIDIGEITFLSVRIKFFVHVGCLAV